MDGWMILLADSNLRGISLSAPPIKVHEETLNRSFSDTLSRSSSDIVGAVSGRYRFQISRNSDIIMKVKGGGDDSRPFMKMQRDSEQKEKELTASFVRLSGKLNMPTTTTTV